jgi:hypothetical protein
MSCVTSRHTLLRGLFKSLTLALCLAILPTTRASQAATDQLTEDGARFELAGATTFRWMSIVKVYDARLHLGNGEPAAKVFTDIPVRLQLTYHRGFTAAEIIKGGDTLLARNVKADALVSLRERLELINRAYRDVREGDSYTLTYVPGKGTTLRLNGSPLVSIPGHDFASAYFRIWLGDDPISKSMRDTLLGR